MRTRAMYIAYRAIPEPLVWRTDHILDACAVLSTVYFMRHMRRVRCVLNIQI